MKTLGHLSWPCAGSFTAATLLALVFFASYVQAQDLVLSTISPSDGKAGDVITIQGENFGPAQGKSSVKVAGISAPVKLWSDKFIKIAVPASAKSGPADVLLTIDKIKEEHPGPFTVQAVSHLSPAQGPPGTVVTIGGTGFGAAQGTSKVRFGGTEAVSILLWSDTRIAARVPDPDVAGDPPLNVSVKVGKVVKPEGTFMLTAADLAQAAQPEQPAKPAATSVAKQAAADKPATPTTPTPEPVAPKVTPLPPGEIPATPAIPARTPDSPVTLQPAADAQEPVEVTQQPTHAAPPLAPESPKLSFIPTSGGPGTSVTITGSGFGTTLGKVNFGGQLGTVVTPKTDWTDTKIIVKSPDFDAGASVGVPVDVAITGGATMEAADYFTETPSRWGDRDMRPLGINFVGGYEQGFQSSQAASSDGFLAFYGRTLFLKNHFGPTYAVRLQTAPQASGTNGIVTVLTNPSGAITTASLQSVGSAIDFNVGFDYQFAKMFHGQSTLSAIGVGGFVTPLQANSINATYTMPPFGTIECAELQGRLATVLQGAAYTGITANTTAAAATSNNNCFSNNIGVTATSGTATGIKLLEYAAPDQPNFFPKFGGGLRLVNRFPTSSTASKQCTSDNPCVRGYVDFTMGQNASITGGILQYRVMNIDAIHPLIIPGASSSFVYLFGSISKRFGNLPPTVPPLVLSTGTATTTPINTTLVLPLTQPDRDFYRIGAGVSLDQIFSALKAKATTNNNSTLVGGAPGGGN